MTREETVNQILGKYMDAMKTRSVKWYLRGNSKWGDRIIKKHIQYFCLPIEFSDVLALLDTTLFHTGKEGYLFTTEGVVVKEIINKLYYLKYDNIEKVEVQEERDEAYRLKTKLVVTFKDGSTRQMLDYDIHKYMFAEYMNETIHALRGFN